MDRQPHRTRLHDPREDGTPDERGQTKKAKAEAKEIGRQTVRHSLVQFPNSGIPIALQGR